MPPPTVDISVVIVAWKAKRYLELCLDSLEKAPPRRSMEILVVDNASADGTAEMVETRFPKVRLIRSDENLGFAKGNNLAIRQCQGRYIALVNPDVIVLPGCLDALSDFLDSNPKVGNVGPRVLNPDGSLQETCRRHPTLWNNFCEATGLAGAFKGRRFFSGQHMTYFPHDRVLTVDVLVGCFSMIRREAFEAVGLLAEDLFMYGDDIDWCLRCWNAGWQVAFCPSAQAIHDQGSTTAPYPVRFALAQQRSRIQYWTKHHSPLAVLGIRCIMLLHHLLRYTAAALSSLARPKDKARCRVKRQVSSACLRGLVTGNVPVNS